MNRLFELPLCRREPSLYRAEPFHFLVVQAGTTSLVHISIAIGCYLFALKPTAEQEIKDSGFFYYYCFQMRVR